MSDIEKAKKYSRVLMHYLYGLDEAEIKKDKELSALLKELSTVAIPTLIQQCTS